ncbi:hypothetical protein J8273_4778 [Carpediemonas membranifera]|nr:hypothetical protein J8273_4778 [Carpediemonas membranifera]|eukprot:KAG9393659.1 hypothetical protein J8273_4778 [Carpediemonas membranifera]
MKGRVRYPAALELPDTLVVAPLSVVGFLRYSMGSVHRERFSLSAGKLTHDDLIPESPEDSTALVSSISDQVGFTADIGDFEWVFVQSDFDKMLRSAAVESGQVVLPKSLARSHLAVYFKPKR